MPDEEQATARADAGRRSELDPRLVALLDLPTHTIPLSWQALKALERTMWGLAGELAALIGDAKRASDH